MVIETCNKYHFKAQDITFIMKSESASESYDHATKNRISDLKSVIVPRLVHMHCRLTETINPIMEKIMNIEIENSWSNKTVEIENELGIYQT